MPTLRVSLLILIFAVTAWSNDTAAPLPDSATHREKVTAFFTTIMQGDAAKASDTLLAGSTISANKPEASYNLRRQVQTSLTAYGKPLGYDVIEEKFFGGALIRLICIFRLEKAPLTFEFFFYQNDRTTLPIDVRFSDKLDVYRYDRVPTATDNPAP